MTKTIYNSNVFHVLENWAPQSLAYDWDNVGLQVGAGDNPVNKVMITLDVLESVVDEAIDHKVDLIIAHHPLLFKSIKNINTTSPKGRVIQKLLQNGITVYAAHTNLDIANGGVNDQLCELLNISSTKSMIEEHSESLFKVVVFTPHTHADDVRNALSEAGSGHIGNYSHCTFQTEGNGTFKPLEGTNPYSGKQHELALVDELKIETIVQQNKLSPVIQSMIKAHPYEEVAYDIYPLENKGEHYGIGRVGYLKEPMTLHELCEQIKDAFSLSALRVTGDLTKQINKVALLGGSGEKFIHQAKQMGADAYITGDMTFHVAQEAWEIGLPVIDPGHYIENVMKEATQKFLKQHFTETDLEIILSTTNTEPFQFV